MPDFNSPPWSSNNNNLLQQLFGMGGPTPTLRDAPTMSPDQIRMQREMAANLMKGSGNDLKPYYSKWGGAANAFDKALGGWQQGQADRAEQAGQQQAQQDFQSLLKGISGGPTPSGGDTGTTGVVSGDTPTPTAPDTQNAPESPTGDLMAFIRQRESFKPNPYPDGKQTSIGYGTRAQPGETSISRDDAEARLNDEVGKASSAVDKFSPNLPPNIKNALTDLTYNTGTKWQNSGLGQAVKNQDWATAKDLFTQYNHADGKVLPGLTSRRNAMAGAFDQPGQQPVQVASAGNSVPVSGTPADLAQNAGGNVASTTTAAGGGNAPGISQPQPQSGIPLRGNVDQAALSRFMTNKFADPAQKTAIMQALMKQPATFGVIGQHVDTYGNVVQEHGFIDPYNRQVYDIHGRPISQRGAGSPSGSQEPGNINWDESDPEKFIKGVPPELQPGVKAYIDGRQMPTGNPRKVDMVKRIAQKYGDMIGMPVDDTTYNARKTMRNDLAKTTPGSLGGQITNGNTAIGHLTDLSDSTLKLGNVDVGENVPFGAPISHGINAFKNWQSSGQSPIVKELKANALKYGQEITKFYAGSGGGVTERMEFEKDISNANTPREFAAVLAKEAQLMQSRLYGLQNNIQRTLGDSGVKAYPIVSKESEKALEKLQANVSRLNGLDGPPSTAPQQPPGSPPASPAGITPPTAPTPGGPMPVTASTPPAIQSPAPQQASQQGTNPIVQGQADARAMIDNAIRKELPNYKPQEYQPTFIPSATRVPGLSLPGTYGLRMPPGALGRMQAGAGPTSPITPQHEGLLKLLLGAGKKGAQKAADWAVGATIFNHLGH